MKQTSSFRYGLDYRMTAHTGIGTYLRGLVSGFTRNRNPAADQLVLFSPERASPGTFSKVLFSAPIYSFTEQQRYFNLINLCQLWHAPHYNIPFLKRRAKLVVTIHDLIHWVYREKLNPLQRLYAETFLSRSAKIADHIITVSEHSKRDLIRFLHVAPEKISVVYNGIDPDFYPLDSGSLAEEEIRIRKKYSLPDSFFLYVGMLKPHKNVLRLMQVYLKLRAERKINKGLIVLGKGSDSSPEMRFIRDARSEILHLPQIDYGELRTFYNMAHALIHPSLYEGFGLTVLEALACGTPVLTTRRASLPEVGGDAVRYIDGEDEVELACALAEWGEDDQLREKMTDHGFLRAAKFSWDLCARETVRVYEKVLNS